MKKTRAVRGLSLLEVIATLTIFGGIMVLTTLLLNQSVWVWTTNDARGSAALVLRKARETLSRDLLPASLKPSREGLPRFEQTQVQAALGGGNAIWFLSAAGANDTLIRDPDGHPLWQRNILYYLVKPRNHDELYAMNCQLGSDPRGDDYCPHKLLLRLVIDKPPTTSPPAPGGIAAPEELLSDAQCAQYILAPEGLDTSQIRLLPGVEDVKIVATSLLWFKVSPSPDSPTEGIEIDLRAVAIQEAAKQLPLGRSSLLSHHSTSTNIFSIFPKN